MSNLKVIKAEVENFKNLSKKVVDINGKSIVVIGSNDEGKSSFIQAILSPFNELYKPVQPIKDGEERGSVEVKIAGDIDGEEVEYNVEMYFSQEHQKGRLKLSDKDGNTIKNARTVLDAVIGDISFDVDLFLQHAKTPSGKESKEGAKKQIEMLKAFLPMDVQKELEQCDIDRLEIYKERTEINNEVKFMETQNKHEFTDEELEAFGEVKSEDEVNKKLGDIGTAIENWQRIATGVKHSNEALMEGQRIIDRKELVKHQFDVAKNFTDSVKEQNSQEVATVLVHVNGFKAKFATAYKKIQEFEKEMPGLKEKVAKGNAWLEKNPKPTTEALIEEQKSIKAHNLIADKIAVIKANHSKITEKKSVAGEKTKMIEGCVQRKKDIFKANPLPVKGLSFDDERVLYKDLPFNETTHPKSTIIAVGVQIAMAMNPNLKIIIIRDGSLLDKELFTKILGMIEKKGFQLFIEMVDWEGSELDVQFAEKFIK